MTPEQRPYIEFRQPRDLSDVINATFAFVRDEFRGIATALLVIIGPLVVIASILSLREGMDVVQGIFTAEYWLEEDDFDFGVTYAIALVMQSVVYLGAYVLFYAYAMLYAEHGPGPFPPMEVFRRMRASFWPYFTTLLWLFLFTIPVVLINIVPCLGQIASLGALVWAAPIAMLVFPARLHRREGFISAFGRCRRMLKGQWLSAFGLFVIMMVVVILISIALAAAIMSVQALTVSLLGTGVIAGVLMVALHVASLAIYVVYMLPVVGFVIHYFNLVEQHEGLLLEARVESMLDRPAGAPDEPRAFGS